MIIVTLAAMLGSVARYLADFYLPRHGILLVNMLGSFIAGSVLSLSVVFQLNDAVVQAIIGGFAGSLTTFSTVAVSAAQQSHNGIGSAWKTWLLQVGLSIAACLFGIVVSLLFVV